MNSESKKPIAKGAASASSVLEKGDLASVFAQLNASPKGLTSEAAATRLKADGPNALAEKQVSNLQRFLHYFWGPIPWMIELAALLSAAIGHWTDFSIIAVLLIYNAASGFWQERKAADALAALKAGMAPKASALRDGKFISIDAANVVPGDVVQIKLGEIVPADVRFIDGEYISIDQAALTGESLPVDKKKGDVGYSGSIAKQGEMTAVVIATGSKTFFGRTAGLVARAGSQATHSQRAVTKIGDFLIFLSLALAMVLVSFEVFHDLTGQTPWHWSDLVDILRMVLVLLIASIPVAMPTVMTVTNALGALELSKKKAIVSKLEAIEELAGVDVLCSDKTGTLTQNSLTLGDPILFGKVKEQDLVLTASLASQLNDPDPIDQAVLAGLKDKDALKSYKILSTKPFDPVNKRTEASVKGPKGTGLKVTKGAPAVIIDMSKLSATAKAKANQDVSALAAKGFRALAVAQSDNDGKSWTLLGILSLLDPPRSDSKETIARAIEHGLKVKMVTGDDVAIGDQIADELGMGSHLVAANDLFTKDMNMDHLPASIEANVETADGFARVFPEHKYGIVKALQDRGHVVAMTGDGVNDAPALKQADCGIAVSGATDAARAAAALILTAPGLSTIIDAIDEARRIFVRIINYVLFRVSMTLDIMLVVVLGTILFGASPLTPVMIILLALLDDVPIMAIAYDNTILPKNPVRWHMRRLVFNASILGLFSVMQTFGLLLIGHAWLDNSNWQDWIELTNAQLQTIIFLQLVAGGHLLLLVVRTPGWFFQAPYPSRQLFGAITGTQALAVLICGFGWFVTAIPWTVIAMVWLYIIAWMFVLDVVKQLLNARTATDTDPHPAWYQHFLTGRHAGFLAASTGARRQTSDKGASHDGH